MTETQEQVDLQPFFERLVLRKEDIESAEKAYEQELESIITVAGKTFQFQGRWYQIRFNKNSGALKLSGPLPNKPGRPKGTRKIDGKYLSPRQQKAAGLDSEDSTENNVETLTGSGDFVVDEGDETPETSIGTAVLGFANDQ